MAHQLRKILHVDDDDSIRGVTRLALEKVGGFEVLSCSSGSQSLELFAEFAPDLVILDVMMPLMDGTETLVALRKQGLSAQVPILFMTAKVLPAEQERLLQVGAFGVIIKPFDPMQLSAQVLSLWNRFHGQ